MPSKRWVRLMARTSDFQSDNQGSIPCLSVRGFQNKCYKGVLRIVRVLVFAYPRRSPGLVAVSKKRKCGRVWFNAAVLKTAIGQTPIAGSNPSASSLFSFHRVLSTG